MHRNAIAVTAAARALGLDIDVMEFPEGTRTAEDAAAAIGVTVGQIVKSLVFAVGAEAAAAHGTHPGETVVAYVSGSNQLDELALAAATGAERAWRVDANAVRAATGFPVGGVPPFGHVTTMRVFVDEDLLSHEVVWAAAGTPRHVFALTSKQLLETSGAIPARLARR